MSRWKEIREWERERKREIWYKQTISKIFFSCWAFVLQLCQDRLIDVTLNSLLLFSVCHYYKSCNWVKFDITFHLLLLFSVVCGFASIAIGSSSMSHFIHCSCLVFAGCKFCNWVKFDVTSNSLVLFSVCGGKFLQLGQVRSHI
jgi:hypothetical protein